MKSNYLSYAKGLQSFLFCFGMFILAITFSVVICFSTLYAFHTMNTDGGMAKSSQNHSTGAMKNIYASVK
jgi:hypothetical protein